MIFYAPNKCGDGYNRQASEVFENLINWWGLNIQEWWSEIKQQNGKFDLSISYATAELYNQFLDLNLVPIDNR